MKNINQLPLAALLAVLSFSTQAADADIEHCSNVATLAEMSMKARQTGMDITKAYEIAQSSDNEAIRKLSTMLTTEAYDQPLMSQPENKQRSISEFKSKWMVECMKSRR